MEVGCFSSNMVAMERMMVVSVVEAVVVETLLAAQRSLAFLLMVTGSQLKDTDVLPKLIGTDQRFPMDELHRTKQPDPENKDASDTEDDDEGDDDNDQDEDDGDDEDFSGEEGGEDDDEGDPEEDPEANGNEGSDDEDDDDGDGEEDDEDDGEGEDEDDEEDEDEEEQPPAKKRK